MAPQFLIYVLTPDGRLLECGEADSADEVLVLAETACDGLMIEGSTVIIYKLAGALHHANLYATLGVDAPTT